MTRSPCPGEGTRSPGFVRDLDNSAAFIDRALALNPNLAAAWNLSGWVRAYRGELDLAIEHHARAMRLSPLDPILYNMQVGTAFAHFLAGRYDEASEWANRALREQPNYPAAKRILAASKALAGQWVKRRKQWHVCVDSIHRCAFPI